MDRRHIKGDERRVVVTGLGVVSPYGRGCEVYWQGLAQGQCLIGPLDLFPTDGFRSSMAAQVSAATLRALGTSPAVTGDPFSARGSPGSRGECRA